ncbi:uncharacterized protein LOC110117413 isoform X2 [Athalia rosae]|uniref:uncharacterized protein LOC110117413 isoform X2 n=1 Tax=Athalia rosae TaxID=37344 RepID=UPI0020335AE5|nr:uncharacterized protein LOC110117413 isoform X2 [Athalia rosae]
MNNCTENTPDTSNKTISNDGINELLINAVKNKPELWDKIHKSYADVGAKKKIWAKIAFDLKLGDAFIKTRWKSLRDRYLKEKKKNYQKLSHRADVKSSWHLMSNLNFLNDTVKPRSHTTTKQQSQFEILEVDCPIEGNFFEKTSENNAGTVLAIDSTGQDISFRSFEEGSSHIMCEASYTSESSQDNCTCEYDPVGQQRMRNLSPGPASMMNIWENRHSASQNQSSSRPTKTKHTASPDIVENGIRHNTCKRRKKDQDGPAANFRLDDVEDNFYLSIAKDVQTFNLKTRIRIRQAVLNAVLSIIEDDDTI